jgi:PAS domain S-box-containing protein
MKSSTEQPSSNDRSTLTDQYLNAPIGLCYIDRELRYVHINKWLAATNSRTPQEHIGKTLMEILPEAAIDLLEPQFRKVIETGQPILRGTADVTFPNEPDLVRHFIHNFYPDIDNDGQVVGVTCSVEDVTELRQAEERLRSAHDHLEKRVEDRTQELDHANTRLRRLLESTSAVPWMAEAGSWKFTYVGPQAAELLGYPIEEWYQPDFWVSHVHPDDIDSAINSSLSSSKHHREYHFDYRMIKADGCVVWIHDIVFVQKEPGKAKTLHGFMIDITKRKSVELSLQKSEAHSRQLIESAPDGVIIMSKSGMIQTINQRTEILFGYERDELIGQMVEILIPQNFRAGHTKHRDEYFSNPVFRPMGANLELLGLRKDGTQFPVAISLGHVEIDADKFAIATVRDMTETERVHKIVTGQQERLHLLTKKLMDVQEDERRKIARDLHDDITQRLAALALEAAILQQDSSAKAAPGDESLGEIAKQLRELSTDVNNISRRLHPSILDHLGLAKAIESQCREFQARSGIPVEMDLQDVGKELQLEWSLTLYRILQESLRNIDKHAQADSIEVNLEMDDEHIVLTVTDSGIGFDLSNPGGTGIGLVSMRERAELLGGLLMIQASPGQGATVTTRLPH